MVLLASVVLGLLLCGAGYVRSSDPYGKIAAALCWICAAILHAIVFANGLAHLGLAVVVVYTIAALPHLLLLLLVSTPRPRRAWDGIPLFWIWAAAMLGSGTSELGTPILDEEVKLLPDRTGPIVLLGSECYRHDTRYSMVIKERETGVVWAAVSNGTHEEVVRTQWDCMAWQSIEGFCWGAGPFALVGFIAGVGLCKLLPKRPVRVGAREVFLHEFAEGTPPVGRNVGSEQIMRSPVDIVPTDELGNPSGAGQPISDAALGSQTPQPTN